MLFKVIDVANPGKLARTKFRQ